MNIYFAQARDDEPIEDLFEYKGKYYYYKLEIQDDQFVIWDTCNRHVPFDFESASALHQAVKYLHHTENVKRTADEWLTNSLHRLGQLYGVRADDRF